MTVSGSDHVYEQKKKIKRGEKKPMSQRKSEVCTHQLQPEVTSRVTGDPQCWLPSASALLTQFCILGALRPQPCTPSINYHLVMGIE